MWQNAVEIYEREKRAKGAGVPQEAVRIEREAKYREREATREI